MSSILKIKSIIDEYLQNNKRHARFIESKQNIGTNQVSLRMNLIKKEIMIRLGMKTETLQFIDLKLGFFIRRKVNQLKGKILLLFFYFHQCFKGCAYMFLFYDDGKLMSSGYDLNNVNASPGNHAQ